MNNRKIFQYKPIIIIFLIFSTIILLIYSLGNKDAISFIKYFSYLYSTFALIVVILNVKRFYLYLKDIFLNTNLYKVTKNTLYKNKYIKKYFQDIKYRNLIDLSFSVLINFTFIFMKLISGISNRSIWFVSLSLYYFILTIVKAVLLRNLKKYDNSYEYKVYRNVGCFSMMLNLVLVIMIVQMVRSNVAVVYGGYIIYMTALYSFYLIISAIVNVIKYRKYNSPILSSVKIINLLTASVSILMLQTTMIATFSNDNLSFMRLMNSITGGIISFITLGISTYMIIKGQKQVVNNRS